MTFGQMQQMTERFNQIMGAGLTFREDRLNQMFEDICLAFGYNCSDIYVNKMAATILEQIHGEELHFKFGLHLEV